MWQGFHTSPGYAFWFNAECPLLCFDNTQLSCCTHVLQLVKIKEGRVLFSVFICLRIVKTFKMLHIYQVRSKFVFVRVGGGGGGGREHGYWHLVLVWPFSVMYDHSMSMLTNHQIRHQAISKKELLPWWLQMITVIFLRHLCGYVWVHILTLSA